MRQSSPSRSRTRPSSITARPSFRNLEATFGGRIDAIQGGSTFVTGRTTLAYRIDETGTRLHGSFGNGAKAPTLYQRYSQYGDPNLQPEQSIGGDVGFDQQSLAIA